MSGTVSRATSEGVRVITATGVAEPSLSLDRVSHQGRQGCGESTDARVGGLGFEPTTLQLTSYVTMTMPWNDITFASLCLISLVYKKGIF